MFWGIPDSHPDPLVGGTYGSEDPDPHPDPYQNVTDPAFKLFCFLLVCCCWSLGKYP
jgi:hypothetical protein